VFLSTGDKANPAWTQKTSGNYFFKDFDIGFHAAPSCVDFTGDGKVDCVVAHHQGDTQLDPNWTDPPTNTRYHAKFFVAKGPANNLELIDKSDSHWNPFNNVELYHPFCGDLDDDGDVDCLDGRPTGEMVFYWAAKMHGTLPRPVYLVVPAGKSAMKMDADLDAAPTCAGDFDGDGRVDCAVGNQHGQIWYARGIGTSGEPKFYPKTDYNPLGAPTNLGARYGERLSCIDMNGDQTIDCVIGRFDGTISYLKNTGTITEPVFELQQGSGDNPFFGLSTSDFFGPAPACADFDNDGDVDCVIGLESATSTGFTGSTGYRYLQNTAGAGQNPAFTQLMGAQNPFNGYAGGNRNSPSCADFDNDGDIDW